MVNSGLWYFIYHISIYHDQQKDHRDDPPVPLMKTHTRPPRGLRSFRWNPGRLGASPHRPIVPGWDIVKHRSGWWFGCHEFYFPRFILGCCHHHPNWRTRIFFRGVAKNHQPVRFIFLVKSRWRGRWLVDHLAMGWWFGTSWSREGEGPPKSS